MNSKGWFKWGADIYFKNGDYYRDSYNNTNLAWIIGEHYWNCKNRARLMKKLANITDKQIRDYIATKIRKAFILEDVKFTPKKRKEWEAMFMGKRNQLRRLLEGGALKIAKDGWSV